MLPRPRLLGAVQIPVRPHALLFSVWRQTTESISVRSVLTEMILHVTVRSSHSLFQKVLLGADDRAGPADPNPGNGLCSREAVMLHEVAANQGACPAETSYTHTNNSVKRNHLSA